MAHSEGEESYFAEKYRGNRRWEGRRNKGEDLMAKKHGHKTTASIRKDILADVSGLSKREQKRLLAISSDDMAIGVGYTLNKHNRWMLANKPVELLKMAKEGFETSVIEQGFETLGDYWPYFRPHNVTAVHTRIDRDEGDMDQFDIRTARSSGKGQYNNLKNFSASAREESVKKPRATKKTVQEDSDSFEEEPEKSSPQAVYRIQKALKNKHMFTKSVLFNYNYCRNDRHTARSRKLPEDELYDGEDEEYEDEYEVDEQSAAKPSTSFNLADCMVEKKKKVREPRDRVRSLSSSLQDDWERVSELSDVEQQEADVFGLSQAMEETYFYKVINVLMKKWKPAGLDSQEVSDTISKFNGRRVSGWTVFNLTDSVKLYGNELMPVNVLYVGIREYKKTRRREEDQLVVVINSTIPAPPFFYINAFRDKLDYVQNLETVLTTIANEIRTWRELYRTAIEQCTELPPSFQTNAEDTRFQKAFYYWLLKQYALNKELFCRNTANYSSYSSRNETIDFTVLAHYACTNSKLISNKAHRYNLLEFESSLREFGKDVEILGTVDEKAEKPLQRCYDCYEFNKYNLVTLKEKTLCLSCIDKDAQRQIRMGLLPIQYQLSNDDEFTFDLLSIAMPLPIFNFYSKKLLMLSLEPFTAEGEFGECYACSSLIFMPSLPPNQQFGTTNCDGCGSFFCSTCGCENHWPMNCEEYREWDKKWDAQYFLETAREENRNESPQTELLRIKCQCKKGKFTAYSTERAVKCPYCGIVVDILAMQIVRGQFVASDNNPLKRIRFYNPNWYKIQEPFKGTILTRIRVENIVKKPITDLCYEARKRRFNRKISTMFLQKCSEMKRRGMDGAENLDEQRKMVLQVIENGTAWVYMRKREGDMLKDMKTLLEKWINVENCVMNMNEANLAPAIASLKAHLNVCVDKLRKESEEMNVSE